MTKLTTLLTLKTAASASRLVSPSSEGQINSGIKLIRVRQREAIHFRYSEIRNTGK